MKQKRQIIKTRSQQPYIIARMIIAFLAAAIAAVIAWWYYHHPVRAHASIGATLPRAVLTNLYAGRRSVAPVPLTVARTIAAPGTMKERHVAGRMPPIRTAWERVCS